MGVQPPSPDIKKMRQGKQQSRLYSQIMSPGRGRGQQCLAGGQTNNVQRFKTNQGLEITRLCQECRSRPPWISYLK